MNRSKKGITSQEIGAVNLRLKDYTQILISDDIYHDTSLVLNNRINSFSKKCRDVKVSIVNEFTNSSPQYLEN